MENISYWEAMGKHLVYRSSITRPDIYYAVNKVCRLNQNPGMPQCNVVKRIYTLPEKYNQ